MGKKSNTFCLAPWISIHNWPDGKTYPCCLWDSGKPIGNLEEQTLKEIWNSDEIKKTRVKMLNGEQVKACSRCYELERNGEHSYRQRINEQHGKYETYADNTNPDGSLDNMNLHLWDLRISNFCNFKCRSCGSELSSSWYEDNIKLGKGVDGKKALISITNKSKFLDEIEEHYKCVDEIYFAGGEPLLMPEHYQILDRLIDLGRTDVNIRYSTNFSKLNFGKKSILEYWKHFSNIELYISVDGVEQLGEYVRKGYDNSTFVENIKLFKESGIKTTAYGYTVTYGVLNFLHLFDMILYFIKNDLLVYKEFDIFKDPAIVFNPITQPTYYDSKFVPDRYKVFFNSRLKTFPRELKEAGADDNYISFIMGKFEPVKNHINSSSFNTQHMSEFVDITNKLDKIRNEKFSDIFPFFASPEALNNNAEKLDNESYSYIRSLI